MVRKDSTPSLPLELLQRGFSGVPQGGSHRATDVLLKNVSFYDGRRVKPPFAADVRIST
jgi:hypothetical protein